MVTTDYAGDTDKTVVEVVTYTMTMNDNGMTEETDTMSQTLQKNIMTNTTTTDNDGNSHYVIISKADGSTVDYTIT